MADIAVVDYGMGNLRSVAKALERVAPGHRVVVTNDPGAIAAAERVVVPGQGAMPDCMKALDARGLRAAVIDAARHKPWLGLCLGLQMLFERSEEGDTPGLGVLPGRVLRFPRAEMVDAAGIRLKVPHMGWNRVRQVRPHPLWAGIPDGERFYFVHSYYAQPADGAGHDVVAGVSAYPFDFTCAVARGGLFAVQFHPEKSQAAGLRLLTNFAGWTPA
ncbi:MAG: imidazole glycerol phosphate synthase subunit HisH [Burkholderiales bacterium]